MKQKHKTFRCKNFVPHILFFAISQFMTVALLRYSIRSSKTPNHFESYYYYLYHVSIENAVCKNDIVNVGLVPRNVIRLHSFVIHFTYK